MPASLVRTSLSRASMPITSTTWRISPSASRTSRECSRTGQYSAQGIPCFFQRLTYWYPPSSSASRPTHTWATSRTVSDFTVASILPTPWAFDLFLIRRASRDPYVLQHRPHRQPRQEGQQQ